MTGEHFSLLLSVILLHPLTLVGVLTRHERWRACNASAIALLFSSPMCADGYQEGCMSALIDGDTPLWLSSGLEDYFLGVVQDSHLGTPCGCPVRCSLIVSCAAQVPTSTRCRPSICPTLGLKISSRRLSCPNSESATPSTLCPLLRPLPSAGHRSDRAHRCSLFRSMHGRSQRRAAGPDAAHQLAGGLPDPRARSTALLFVVPIPMDRVVRQRRSQRRLLQL